MIVSYSFGEKAIYISDYRVTLNKELKYDNNLKFIDIDKKIGLFMSGNVQYWKLLLQEIKNSNKSSNINIDNILDEEGPFRESLVTAALKDWDGVGEASGFIIDEKQGINKQFYIEAKAKIGCTLKEIIPNSTYIFGLGSIIPKIKNEIVKTIDWYQQIGKNDLYEIGSGVRNCIKKLMVDCGASSFKKLVISPIFNISILDKGHFKICGEYTKGGHYKESSTHCFNYSLQQDSNNDISLIDSYTKKVNSIYKIDELDVIEKKMKIDKIFDPEKLTKEKDPSDTFPNEDYVFEIHQWPIKKYNIFKSNMVLRTIYKVEFLTEHRLCNRKKIKENLSENIKDNEISKYKDVDKYYTILTHKQESNFNNGVVKDSLFNDSWLASFIPNYKDIYYK